LTAHCRYFTDDPISRGLRLRHMPLVAVAVAVFHR